MMKKIKWFSLLLAAALLVTALPFNASAATVICGDLDGDGMIAAADARLLLRWSVGLETEESLAKDCAKPNYDFNKAADVDLDGNITAADARAVLRASVGLERKETLGMDDSQIYRAGHFYLKGVIHNAEDVIPLQFSMTKDSTYFLTELDFGELLESEKAGPTVDIALMQLGQKVYFAYPAGKTILHLDPSEDGDGFLNMDEISGALFDLRLINDPYAIPDRIETETVDGKALTAYTFSTPEGAREKHLLEGSKLRYVHCYNKSGEFTAQITVESITTQVPDEQASLPAGYTLFEGEGSTLLFFFRLLADVGIDLNDIS